MSKIYTCDLCKKIFNQKIDFTRHLNKKAPCISLTEIQKINQIKEVKMDVKTELINVLKNCLNILRDNEGLTGEKALRNMSYLLILKLIEPHLGNEINIDNYKYDFSAYDFGHNEEKITKYKNKLLKIARFSNLVKENENDIPNNMKSLWDDILAVHPSTKNIFLKGKEFDIQHQSTYKKIIDKLNSINLSQTEYDVLGNAYEEVIQDIMTGKVLGQFFTQPLVKKMMVKLINPQIHPDGKIDTCGDPTMGTGGFLITYLQYILQQAKLKNIKPDWNFIKSEGLYGKELEPDTYQLAVSNMLISSGHMFEYLDRGDSIRQPITRKFDNILANPPFGIKGLNYDDFKSSIKGEYVPIKTDNAVSLFIQAIIYMLKIGGKCAVVLPDGQDLFSKTNTTLVAIREYLMKTCDLKEIIYLPSGIFTYTTIKTCVFYFIKKREGSDVLETKIKVSKTQKEIGRDYKFSKTLQTTKVKFYDYNPYEDVKNLLVKVPIEKIASNLYSLNYTEYIKDETKEEQYEDSVIVKTLGEICKFLPKSKRQASYGEKHGEYPFYTSSQTCSKYCDEYDYEDECIIIGTGGTANIKYSSRFSCSTDNFVIKINTGQLVKYIYYYLSLNIEVLQKGFIGVGLQHISKEYISNIKVPIPSLERQQEIVKYLDFIYEKANKTSREKIAELKQLNEFCLNNQKIFGDNVVKTLGEVCEVNQGNSLTKTEMIDGIYNVIGGGKIIGKHNQKNRDGKDFTLTRVGDININYIDNPYFLTDNGFSLKSKQEDILTKYLYYLFLHNKDYLTNLYQGTAQKVISKTNLKSIKISISTLECQKEIIEYCEHNDNLIKQLEKEIENNKKQAHQFITGIVKAQVQIEEQSDTNLVNIESIESIDKIQNEDASIEEDLLSNEKDIISSIEEDVIIEIKENKKKVKKVKKSNVFINNND
jgi:type I restriction-modification system DNA methylase subunit